MHLTIAPTMPLCRAHADTSNVALRAQLPRVNGELKPGFVGHVACLDKGCGGAKGPKYRRGLSDYQCCCPVFLAWLYNQKY